MGLVVIHIFLVYLFVSVHYIGSDLWIMICPCWKRQWVLLLYIFCRHPLHLIGGTSDASHARQQHHIHWCPLQTWLCCEWSWDFWYWRCQGKGRGWLESGCNAVLFRPMVTEWEWYWWGVRWDHDGIRWPWILTDSKFWWPKLKHSSVGGTKS